MDMRTNAGYIITDAIRIGNVEFVIGENAAYPAQFVTWECKGGNTYYLGHYMTSRLAALHDLLDRAAQELSALERRHGSHQESERTYAN